MAVLHARGQLAIGQDFVHEGILGTTWTGRLLRETTIGSLPGGRAAADRIGLDHRPRRVRVDEDDPFPDGFTVGDLWGLTD